MSELFEKKSRITGKDEIDNRYIKLVSFYAKRFSNQICDYEDLLQEGFIAYVNAKTCFDPSKKISFETYLSAAVKNRMINLLRKESKNEKLNLELKSELHGKMEVLLPEEQVIGTEEMKSLDLKLRKMLSTLEFEVLSEYLKGKSYLEISKTLNKDIKVIDNAMARIRQKLSKM